MMTGITGLNPVDLHEYLLKARAKLLDWVRPLTPAQYTQEFPFGLKTLRSTMVEIASGEWVYTRRLRGERIPPVAERPLSRFRETDFAPLERAWQEEVEATRRTLGEIADWSRPVEYTVAAPGQPTVRISTTAAGIATQMFFHEVHHRAQAMAMLRQLGVAAQNLDYSILAFQRSEVPA